MNITGTTIHYYKYCLRKCWLSVNKINLEHNSEHVAIGKAMHEDMQLKSKNTEIQIDNIKIDKITKDYVVEIKKSNADVESARWQLLYYLYVLDTKGVSRSGKLTFVENKSKTNKTEVIELMDNAKYEIETVMLKIKELSEKESIPEITNDIRKCKKCAYYDYCYI